MGRNPSPVIGRISFWNTFSRILFLLLTPAFFRIFNMGFIWHSIYWGVISLVVMIWFFFLLVSPLLGRIGCGWFCFAGTTQDLPFGYALYKLPKRKPILWARILMTVAFFASSFTFFFIRYNSGQIGGIRLIPGFFSTELNAHYQHVWIYDTVGALLLGVLLEKRWACRNLCFMGALCSVGSTYARLIPVIDTQHCNQCKKCETVCLTSIPITGYLDQKKGLVTHAECTLCGRCVDACNRNAMAIRFVWNRSKYMRSV